MVTLKPRHITAKFVSVQVSSRQEKQARRDHDSFYATFLRRLGLTKSAPEFSWGVEDDLAVFMAKEISDEIDKEIMNAIMGTK